MFSTEPRAGATLTALLAVNVPSLFLVLVVLPACARSFWPSVISVAPPAIQVKLQPSWLVTYGVGHVGLFAYLTTAATAHTNESATVPHAIAPISRSEKRNFRPNRPLTAAPASGKSGMSQRRRDIGVKSSRLQVQGPRLQVQG